MDLIVKEISIDDFNTLKAKRCGRGGCVGDRQEYFTCEKLDVDNAVYFQYPDYEAFKRERAWAIQYCKRKNQKNDALFYRYFGDGTNCVVCVAKTYREEK